MVESKIQSAKLQGMYHLITFNDMHQDFQKDHICDIISLYLSHMEGQKLEHFQESAPTSIGNYEDSPRTYQTKNTITEFLYK